MTILAEHRTIHLDWSQQPLRFARLADLPPSDTQSVESANTEAQLRVQRALEPYLSSGWQLDPDVPRPVMLEKKERRVLLPTPGTAGPMWIEYVGAEIHLRRS